MKAPTFLSQTIHSVGSMAGNQALQIAAGIAISRIYGPPGKGLVTYAGIAILGVVAISDGLSAAIARQCADDRRIAPAVRAAALRIILIISAIAAIPLIFVGLNVRPQHALLFVGIAFPFALYVQTMSGFHLIAMRVERTNAASMVINAGAAFAMLLATLLSRPPIDVIMSIWTVGYVAGAAILFGGFKELRADKAPIDAQMSKLSRFALRSSSASLMTFFASRVDMFIVAATLSAAALGNYTLALAVGELMWQIARALSWSAYGRVAKSTLSNAVEITAKITRIVLAVEVIIAVLAFAAGPSLLALIYGPDFADAGPVLRILLPGMALYAGDALLSYFVSVKIGRPGVVLRIEAMTLIACVVGSLATVSRFGIIGPAVATTLAYSVSFVLKVTLFLRVSGLHAARLLIITPADFRTERPTGSSPGRVVA